MTSSERFYWGDPTSTTSSGNSGALGFSDPHGVDPWTSASDSGMKIMPVFFSFNREPCASKLLNCQPKIALAPHSLTSSFDATRRQVEDKQLDGG